MEFKRRSASSSFARSAAVSSTSPPSTREATPIGKRAARDGLKVPRGHPENLRQQNRISDENYWFCFSWKTRQKDHDLSERPSGHSTSHLSHVMAASYAADVGGGSHHDALLSLRDLPSFQDKYTVEVRRPFGQDTFPLFFSFSFVTSQRLGVRPTPPPRRCLRPMGSRSRAPTSAPRGARPSSIACTSIDADPPPLQSTCGSAATAAIYGARPRLLKGRFVGLRICQSGTLTEVVLTKRLAWTARLFWSLELFSGTRFEPRRATDNGTL